MPCSRPCGGARTELVRQSSHKPPLMFAQAPLAIGKLAALKGRVKARSRDTRKVQPRAQRKRRNLSDDGELRSAFSSTPRRTSASTMRDSTISSAAAAIAESQAVKQLRLRKSASKNGRRAGGRSDFGEKASEIRIAVRSFNIDHPVERLSGNGSFCALPCMKLRLSTR